MHEKPQKRAGVDLYMVHKAIQLPRASTNQQKSKRNKNHEHLKTTLSSLLVAAGEGNTELHTVPIDGRDIRDGQPETEAELQAALIAMIPTPGGSHDEGGLLVRNLLAEFLRGFSLRTLIFLLDMVYGNIHPRAYGLHVLRFWM